MLVGEILNKIINKEITINELATIYNVTDQTIQRKIKKLGYEWDRKKSNYKYIGKSPQPLDTDFSTLFRKKLASNYKHSQVKNKDKKKASYSKGTSDILDVLLIRTKVKRRILANGHYK